MTRIKTDPQQMTETALALESQLGIVLPSDTSGDTLIRDLLTALKTRAASKRLAAAKRPRGDNPDSPRRKKQIPDDADFAKRFVDKQEAYHRNPNCVRAPS